MPMEETSSSSTQNNYGKRPMWQWVVIYLVIAVILYGAFYYFFLAKKGGYSTNSTSTYVTPTVSQTSPTQASSELLMTKTDSKKGDYLTDGNGMTLYIFDNDTKGVSNCTGNCATNWPPYLEGSTAPSSMPANLTTIKRTDGTTQYAYKGLPLYYYQKDKAAGDTLGDGVNGTWHLVKP